MTAQGVLPIAPEEVADISAVAALVEEPGGAGRVYVRGELTYLWTPGDVAGRRLAAVALVQTRAATWAQVAGGFGIGTETLRRWIRTVESAGAGGLVPERRGPKGPSKLTQEVVADIRARRAGGESYRAIAAAVGISHGTVAIALGKGEEAEPVTTQGVQSEAGAAAEAEAPVLAEPEVLARPAARIGEREAARGHLIKAAKPVFTPAGQVPLAGLMLALPGLEATGLLASAREIYRLRPGFYGLATMLTEAVFRGLAGAPRAEGAGRFDPVDLGRVLGMDRAPEVKTIRRKMAQLAAQDKAADLLAAMARHHLARQAQTNTNTDAGADGEADDAVGMVLYVDGHVRAYTGTKKIAKTHSARLRFPAPATVETWVSDADGDPVLVVMAEPGASLAGELRRLLPDLRAAVGDDRRVLVGFDRGGWSPALFKYMHDAGFDVLTWRKGPAADIDDSEFTETIFVDEAGRKRKWRLAETMVELPLPKKNKPEQHQDDTFTMRQITRLETKKGQDRQSHILTTRTDLPATEVVYRMGSRWRQENYFRYARIHFDLDAHHAYGATDDDPTRMVPNPAKKTAHQVKANAAAKVEREKARAQAALLAARTGTGGQEVVITNALHNQLTRDWHQAEDDLAAAQGEHAQIPARIPLGELAPGQQVLDPETKLLSHAIKMAAFNTITAIARAIRGHTTYARAQHEAFTLARQVLTHTGDILPDPASATLTIRLDPMPTARETAAVAELCQHLTATNTTYPGTDLRLRYQVKNRP